MKLKILDLELTVARYTKEPSLPPGAFASVMRVPGEVSVVCESRAVPAGAEKVEAGWRAIKVEGTLDFALTGILSNILKPLAQAKISIFAMSTFDTDYILVRQIDEARAALEAAGYVFI